MRHAVEQHFRQDDPTRDVERLKERAQGTRTWSEADIAAYEAHWQPSTRQRLALALLLYTGQRRSDVVRMGRQHLVPGGNRGPAGENRDHADAAASPGAAT